MPTNPLALLLVLAVAAIGGASLAIDSSAEAAVCARGIRGAACAGPHGAVAVRRAPVVRRRAVIVR